VNVVTIPTLALSNNLTASEAEDMNKTIISARQNRINAAKKAKFMDKLTSAFLISSLLLLSGLAGNIALSLGLA